ncbi:hypothetical protein CAZ03_34775 [Pseudomonas aeruginosa]|nr:hypothetical protein CAZ03_34775 [Pseudomonas aeruginosa]
MKSVIVPSVQSPPSMLKLHDFCNRASKKARVTARASAPAFPARPIAASPRPERVSDELYLPVSR